MCVDEELPSGAAEREQTSKFVELFSSKQYGLNFHNYITNTYFSVSLIHQRSLQIFCSYKCLASLSIVMACVPYKFYDDILSIDEEKPCF